jgi:hypothetical protein
MNWARWRIAGEGESVNEWNRLAGFRAARVFTEGPVAVCAARWRGEALGAQQDCPWVCLGLASVLEASDLRCVPKLRIRGGIALRRVRLWRRAWGAEARAP